jgi:hypothetical protein
VRYSTSAPLAMSFGNEYSFGESLMPPLLGMKIMPIGATLEFAPGPLLRDRPPQSCCFPNGSLLRFLLGTQ